MLKFNKQQSDLIIRERMAFNASQKAMAAKHGLPVDLYGVNTSLLHGNASPLPKDAWGLWDKDFVQIQRDVLSVYNDVASSLTFSLPIGKIVHHFAQISDAGKVNISLDGQSEAKADSAVISYQGTPVPIVDSVLSLGFRQVAAAMSDGVQLDSAQISNHQRKVAEKLEDMIINGDSTQKVGTAEVYGLTNHPKRNTRSTGVTLNGATGAQWNAEIVACIQALQADNFYTPATFYLNYSDWFYASSTDFSTQYPNKTILQRILEIPGVEKIIPASKVSANTIIGLIKRREVVQILSAMPPVMRPKTRLEPEDPYIFKVMAATAPEFKYDADDNCGIIHSS